MKDNLRDHLKSTLSSLMKYFIVVIIFGSLIVYLLSGFYTIAENELGIVQRFGKVIDEKVSPGGHYKLPWPIDVVTKVPVKTTHTIKIRTFSVSEDKKNNNFKRATGLSSYCLTGDNNIVFIDFRIRYYIVEPVKYLFSMKNNEIYLRELASASIIKCLAGKTVDDILTVGKKSVETYLKLDIQQNLDLLNSGFGISAIEIREVSPHESVRPYFERVINAQIQQREMRNKAESYKNEILPKAKGTAIKIKEEAWAYKAEIINRAKGNVERFKKQLAVYSNAKDITRQRIYLDFIQQELPTLKKVIFVESSGQERIVDLKLL